MRRFLLAIVLVFLLGPAAAPASAQIVPVIPTEQTRVMNGFLYWTWAPFAGGHRFTTLNAYDFDPGTQLLVTCADPAVRCPFRPGGQTVGAGRQASLSSILNRTKLDTPDRIVITATHPDGRTKNMFLQMGRRKMETDSSCALQDGTPSACIIQCPFAEPRPTTQPCASVTQRSRKFSKKLGVRWNLDWDRQGRSHFTRFVLHDLPSGTSVYLLCLNPHTGLSPCNRPVAFVPPAPPGRALDLDLTSLVRGRKLPPGTTMTMRLRKPGYRMQQLTFKARKFKAPTRRARCVDADQLTERLC